MSVEYYKFSDFSEEEVGLEGDKKKIEEILNTEILVISFRIGKSKYKEKEYIDKDMYRIFDNVCKEEGINNPLKS